MMVIEQCSQTLVFIPQTLQFIPKLMISFSQI